MDAFATLEDLELFLGRNVDPARGELFLELASSAIRDHLRQRVNRMTETVRLPLPGGRRLWLPELPVWEVTDVTLSSSGTATDLVVYTDYRLDVGPGGMPASLVRRGGSTWPDWYGVDDFVELTYDHGFDVPGSSSGAEHPLPDVFKTRCIVIAARGLGNPMGDRQESAGRYSVTRGGAGDALGLNVNAADEEALAYYFPGSTSGARR